MFCHCSWILTAALPAWYSQLVLAGMELISFLAAHMGLCFGFVLQVLTAHPVLPTAEQCLPSIKASSLPVYFPHHWAGWGRARGWGAPQPGTLTPLGNGMLHMHNNKAQGREDEGGVHGYGICPTHAEALLSEEPSACRWEVGIFISLFCAHSFCFPYCTVTT